MTRGWLLRRALVLARADMHDCPCSDPRDRAVMLARSAKRYAITLYKYQAEYAALVELEAQTQ